MLQRGTAGYLATEEGLAINAALNIIKKKYPDYENQAIYKKYIMLEKAQHSNFQQLSQQLITLNQLDTTENTYLRAFN